MHDLLIKYKIYGSFPIFFCSSSSCCFPRFSWDRMINFCFSFMIYNLFRLIKLFSLLPFRKDKDENFIMHSAIKAAFFCFIFLKNFFLLTFINEKNCGISILSTFSVWVCHILFGWLNQKCSILWYWYCLWLYVLIGEFNQEFK